MRVAISFAIVAFCATAAHAQVTKPQPKDNVVLIQTPDSAVVALKKLAVAFVAQGYTVDKLDTQFLTLTLAPKTLPVKYSPELTIRATATAGAHSSLRLAGAYKGFVGSIAMANIAQFYGSEWACNKSTFREIEKVALTYPSGQVSYNKQ